MRCGGEDREEERVRYGRVRDVIKEGICTRDDFTYLGHLQLKAYRKHNFKEHNFILSKEGISLGIIV